MIHRPADCSRFEFVVLAGLRAAQLTRGSIPRIPGSHKIIITAQMEVAEGKVLAVGGFAGAPRPAAADSEI